MTGTNTTTLNQAPNSGAGPARDARGRLLPGHTMGRPVGARGKASRGEIERLRSRSERMWQLVDEKLAEGDTKVLLFLLSRILPDARTVELDSTDPATLAEAVTDGTMTSTEANRISQSLKHLREIQQVDAIAERLSEIERLLAVQGRS